MIPDLIPTMSISILSISQTKKKGGGDPPGKEHIMKKYEITKDSFEIRGDHRAFGLTETDISDLNSRRTWWDPEIVESFDTLEAARAAFDGVYREMASTTVRGGSHPYLEVEFYELQVTEYDEDGDPEMTDTIDSVFEPYPARVDFMEDRGGRRIDGAVDFMEARPGHVELYAELPAVDDGSNYEALKAEIIRQADQHGIPVEMLDFSDYE